LRDARVSERAKRRGRGRAAERARWRAQCWRSLQSERAASSKSSRVCNADCHHGGVTSSQELSVGCARLSPPRSSHHLDLLGHLLAHRGVGGEQGARVGLRGAMSRPSVRGLARELHCAALRGPAGAATRAAGAQGASRRARGVAAAARGGARGSTARGQPPLHSLRRLHAAAPRRIAHAPKPPAPGRPRWWPSLLRGE
jgi:hypothetical protein